MVGDVFVLFFFVGDCLAAVLAAAAATLISPRSPVEYDSTRVWRRCERGDVVRMRSGLATATGPAGVVMVTVEEDLCERPGLSLELFVLFVFFADS